MIDIFKSGAKVLVNPVNCVGIMGAGLALQFKNRFPKMYDKYVENCLDHTFKPGMVIGYKCKILDKYDIIVACAATKDHWKDPSTEEYVQECAQNLNRLMQTFDYPSIAIPRLGCGLGGLDWNIVEPMILKELSNEYDVWLDGRIIIGKNHTEYSFGYKLTEE